MSIRIRNYSPSDRDFVQRCLSQLWHQDVEFDSERLVIRAPELEERYASGMLRRYRTNNGFVLIGELDGIPAGFVAGWVTKLSKLERMIQRPNRRGHISELAVLEQLRRRGVGSRLLRAAETRLKKMGCDYIGLDVSIENEGARALYEEFGYGPRTLYLLKRARRQPPFW